MPPRKRKSSIPLNEEQKESSLISLLDNFLNPNLSQVEITQNAFAIQLNLAKYLSSQHMQKSRNLQKKNSADSATETHQNEIHRSKKRKSKEIFDQNQFAEKAILIVDHYLNPANDHDETEEVSQNRLTIMNFIPSLLQKIDSNDQVYIQKLTEQINPNSSSFELQLPLLHSISEILHGPQLANLFLDKIKSYIKPNLSISSSLLNICIFNFETQKNYQLQWAEIIREVFISSDRQQLLNSSLLLKSKRTCSNELCNMLCRVLQNQDAKADKLDFFLILILSSINSSVTNKILKFYTNNNRLNELTIKNCPIQVVPMNNIIDAIYSISSTRNFNLKNDQLKELPRLISEIFINSENSEILTFALFNEDENKILLESTIEAISIASQEAPQLFISAFDSIGILYTVSKQVSRRLISPILKLASVFTQLFDSVVIYLKKLVNHPSGTMIAIDSLCSLLKDLGERYQSQQRLYLSETGPNSKIKSKSRSKKKNQPKSFKIEDQSNSIEMQLEILKVIDSISSTSTYLRYLVFRQLSEVVSYLSDRSRTEAKKIANKYKSTSLDPSLFVNLITDTFSEENDRPSETSTGLIFCRDYPSSIIQLLISLGDSPSDFLYFLEYKNSDFNTEFHFSLQLALRADVYCILSPYSNESFVTFSEYMKSIDFLATNDELKIIDDWCELRLDELFVRKVIVEEETDDPLLLYIILRQINTTDSFINDEELHSSCKKLFLQTSICDDFEVTKIALKKHRLKCDLLPFEAFEDDVLQFREELVVQLSKFNQLDDIHPFLLIDEMKLEIMNSAMSGRLCDAFLILFDKTLPVDSESTKKIFDLLATLRFDDVKIFSKIVDLLLIKSPLDDALTVSSLLLSCAKEEDETIFLKKETLKNAVLIRISKFVASIDNVDRESFEKLMNLLTDLMSFENVPQNVSYALFRSINIVIKKLTDDLNKSVEEESLVTIDDFMKFKNNCDLWFSVNKQKVGIKRSGVCKAYLQMAENLFKKKKKGIENEEEEEDYDDDDDDGVKIHDYGAEFDSLLELLKNEENNKKGDGENDNDNDDFINIDEILLNKDDSKIKKKKKKLKKLPHFVTRKWRSKSKWIDEGLKEVSDSDDNFADLEDFVVENSPPQSDYDNDNDNDNDEN